MNLLLPSFNITETNAHFLNINNFLQKAWKATSHQSDARCEWKIFAALLQSTNYESILKPNNKSFIPRNYIKSFFFNYTKKYFQEIFIEKSYHKNKFYNNYISKVNIIDFYLNDNITKKSLILKKIVTDKNK